MIFRYLWLLLIPILTYPQLNMENIEEYELLFSEVHILMQYTSPSPENLGLIDSANNAASKSEYTLASVYLEVVLDELYAKSNLLLNEPAQHITALPQKFDFRIKSGLDFNRQEFEIGYIESDSVILNEVSKPFIGINLDYLLSGTKQHGLGVDLYVRTDNENTEGRLRLYNPYKRNIFYGYNVFELDYDHNSVNPDIGYWELASRQLLNFSLSKWYFQFNNNFRYKNYNQSSQSVPGFVKNTTNFSTLYEHNLLKNTRIFYQFDFNESINYRNNDFLEHYAGVSLFNWFPGPMANEIKADYIYNAFTYALEDSIIDNTSKTTVGKLIIRTPLFNKYSWIIDYLHKLKTYLAKSEQDPDYWDQELNTSIQKEVSNSLTIGIGYHFQRREHKLFSGSDAIYVKEQNYLDQGVLAEINYNHAANILFTGMISYSKRKYPESESFSTLSFYTSKNIMSVFVLFQAPINNNIGINLFLSYDDDEEMDNDRNDSRSIIFSAELEYIF